MKSSALYALSYALVMAHLVLMAHATEFTLVTLQPEVEALRTNPTHYGDPTGGCMSDELPARI